MVKICASLDDNTTNNDNDQGRSQRSKKRGGDNPGKSGVYKTCGAENFRKIVVKSTVLELQKTYRYKSSSLINFQNNEIG